jgi:Icc protein
MKPTLTFLHLTDTHIGPERDFERYDTATLPCLEQMITLINAMPEPPDFVVHTGDVADDQSAAAYHLAAEALARLSVPIYFVAGNHDDPGLMRQLLQAPDHASGDPDAPLDYTFEVGGERFLVLDAHSPVVPDPQGYISEAQLAWVREVVNTDGPPLTVLLHYPLFKMGSPWLDDNMIIANGAALHEILIPARDRLRGVFSGHLHRSCQIARDGITYTTASSTFSQFAWRPWDATPAVDVGQQPGYNMVQVFPRQVIVHQYGLSGC